MGTAVIDGGNLYEAIGGEEACRALSENFYSRVKQDPLLRPFFPGKTLHCAIEEFAAFLAQLLSGPPELTQRRWWLSLRESHGRFRITSETRDAWMRQMRAAARETLAEPAQSSLLELFETASAYLVNRGDTPRAAEVGGDLGAAWNAQRELDAAAEAVRHGGTTRALELALGVALQEYFERSPSAGAGFLQECVRTGGAELLAYVERELRARPARAHHRFAGRTLLHVAAASGQAGVVGLLLELGLDADVQDGGAHTPLYSVANECSSARGPEVLRALVRAGADVNACEGSKRCTALHMAARRDRVAIAAALLDAGADIEARDSAGETPLRRAVNCGKVAVARLLVGRGADVRSVGSKARTVAAAARSEAMRQVLSAGG